MYNVQEQEEADFRVSTDAEVDREDARLIGERRPEQDWILSDRDVWYPNPYFKGVRGPHPEEGNNEDDGEADAAYIKLMADGAAAGNGENPF